MLIPFLKNKTLVIVLSGILAVLLSPVCNCLAEDIIEAQPPIEMEQPEDSQKNDVLPPTPVPPTVPAEPEPSSQVIEQPTEPSQPDQQEPSHEPEPSKPSEGTPVTGNPSQEEPTPNAGPNVVIVNNPPPFKVISDNTALSIPIQAATEESVVLTTCSGLPDTLHITVYYQGAEVAVTHGNKIVKGVPFTINGTGSFELVLKGRGEMENATIHFTATATAPNVIPSIPEGGGPQPPAPVFSESPVGNEQPIVQNPPVMDSAPQANEEQPSEQENNDTINTDSTIESDTPLTSETPESGPEAPTETRPPTGESEPSS